MKIKIPSKTFLWGEYSALVGGAAGILTTEPHFELTKLEENSTFLKKSGKKIHTEKQNFKASSEAKSLVSLFHPNSPAGMLLESCSEDLNSTHKLYFEDPFSLQGGFGRSTAEWISAYLYLYLLNYKGEDLSLALKDNDFLVEVWRSYQTCFINSEIKPSGYDLIAQLYNTILTTSAEGLDDNTSDPNKLSVIDASDGSFGVSPRLVNSRALDLSFNILIYKTPIKVKTHEHLASLSLENLKTLKDLSSKVTSAYLDRDNDEFLKRLNNFDTHLTQLNYKTSESLNYVKTIRDFDSVVYARGCGALGADVLAVFYEGASSSKLKVKIAQEFDLIFIADVQGID